MKTKAIKLTDKKLQALQTDNKLRNAVLAFVIEHTDDLDERIHFINNALQYGCVSGTVGGLIYYHDTVKFYQEYKEEIFELASEQAKEMGYKNAFELFAGLNGIKDVGSVDQMENLFAWFGFEEMLRIIANELGIEI